MRPFPVTALLVCLPLALIALGPPPPPGGEAQPQADPRPAPTVLAGRVTDADGNPVPNVKVQLYSGLASRWPGQHATTGADGAFRFEPLETGAMTINDGSPAAYFTGIRLEHPGLTSADGANWWDVEVPFGETVRKDFTLVPGARLAGNVTDDEGRRWGDFDLRLIPDDPKASKIGAHYAKTNHRGRFEVAEAIYPGRYQVQWNEPHADYTVLATVDLAAGTTTNLTIPVRLTAEPREVKVEVQPVGEPEPGGAAERE